MEDTKEFKRTYDVYEETVVIRFLYKLTIGNGGGTKGMIKRMHEIEKCFKDEISTGNLSGSLKLSEEENWLWIMHDQITVQWNVGEIVFLDNEKAKWFCEHYLYNYGYRPW